MTDTKRRILHHATEAFLEAPYSRISIREIAQRSGVSHTYIHKAFGGKEGLYRAVALEAARQWSEANNITSEDSARDIVLKGFASNPIEQPVLKLLRRAMTEEDAKDLMLDTFWKDSNTAVETFSRVSAAVPDKVTIELNRDSLFHLILLLIWLPSAAEVFHIFSGKSHNASQQDLLLKVMKPILFGKLNDQG